MNAKLTAYALNELPPDERAALEAEMETNPALRVEAEEMRKFCAMLHDEVTDADKTTLTSEQRFRVLREFSTDTQPQPKKTERSIWKHPAFWVPTAIAACTTAMLVINLKEQHLQSPKDMEGTAVLAQRKSSAEDVRVNFETAQKPVPASQTPAPGKPEIPTLVALNTPTVLSSNADTLPPMPSPSTPASPVLLRRSSLDGAVPSVVLDAPISQAGIGGETYSNFSSINKMGRSAGEAEEAGRGVQIGAARPVEHFDFSLGKLSELSVDPAPAATTRNGYLGVLEQTPSVPSIAADPFADSSGAAPMVSSSSTLALGVDLNEPVARLPEAGVTLSGNNTFTGGLTLNGGGVIATNGKSTAMGGAALPDAATDVNGTVIAGRGLSGSGGLNKVGADTLSVSGMVGDVSASKPAITYAGKAGTEEAEALSANDAIAMRGSAPVASKPASGNSTVAMPESRAKMLNEVNRGWVDPATPSVASTGSTTPANDRFKWQTDATPSAPAETSAGSIVLPATPQAKAPARTFEKMPAGQPADTLSLADSVADGTSQLATGGAPAARAATPASAAPLAPMAASAIPAPVITNPMPADAPRLYAITDKDDDAYLRNTVTTTTTTTESLSRKKEQEVEKLGKDLRQVRVLQESETRARRLATRNTSGETYTPIYENPFLQVAQQPLSTFSIDVDTASYANVRRFLNNGQRPPADAVRLEELINYFPYTYEPPAEDGAPFSVTVDMAEAPWQPMHRLARIALKGREIRKERGAANFVFLVDVSGSMDSPDKLPLVKQSLRMLTDQLKDTDRVAIVTYAGDTGVALTSTPGSERQKIQGSIEALTAGGSTNGAGGIRAAYQQAAQNFIQEGVNRVILCTDGDFNVGISSPEELEKLIAEKAKSRVFLSVLGYGTGNLKDRTMETLADKGNGNYAYIDSLSEARKVLVDQMNATLVTIAKDVKIQVEFNPTQVAAYRLLGYENRALAKEDFNNDRKDAGEIGAGHTVTALYEIVPVGARATSPDGRPTVDDLKYAPKSPPATVIATPAPTTPPSRETMTVKLRYKQPDGDKSQLIEVPVTDKEQTMANAPRDFVFAASVAGFGMMLRNSQHAGELTWDMVRDMALRGKGEDPLGYRGEFLQLIDKARGLTEGRE
jgi:Mg-chelatase subunit ChlD